MRPPRRTGHSGAVLSASTASSAPRRTSGIPTSPTTTIPWSSRSCRRRATTSRSTSPTRRCPSSRTQRWSRRTSRSSSTTAFGAAHAPHHVPKEWADKYKGKFDMGYEAYRELVFANQKKLGIIPEYAELSPINPYTDLKSPTGQGWGELDVVRPWDSLNDDEKHLFSRMAEVYAGFLSHADDQLGRVLDYLEKSGQLDNTLIVLVSDNGASGEGGPNGSVNENKIFNGLPDTIEEALKYADDLGTPKTYNHYPTGWAWAFNTPFKMWKRYASYQGGTADPMIVSWPAQIKRDRHPDAVHARGRHRTDDLRAPRDRNARGRQRLHAAPARGRELRGEPARCRRPRASRRSSTRCSAPVAIYHDGWKAASVTPAAPGAWGDFADPALGAVQHGSRSERVPRPGRGQTREARRSWSRSGGPRRASTAPCRSSRATRSASFSRRGPSSPSRVTGTSTTPTARRCPSRSPRTSATAPTPSRSR